MGFYFGSELDKRPNLDLTPTVTPREYVSVLSGVIRALTECPQQHCRGCQLGLRYLTAPSPGMAVAFFTELVGRGPEDHLAHRLLGIAHLRQGNLRASAKHLELALGLLRREAAVRTTLYDTFRVQYETALLRVVLVPLHMRLGEVHAARFLVMEGQTL